MDDILASIRRILDDDQATVDPNADVLMLDTSMMVADHGGGGTPLPAAGAEAAGQAGPLQGPELPHSEVASTPLAARDETAHTDYVIDEAMLFPDVARDAPAAAAAPLVAPEAAAAAANSVGALMRTLAAERSTVVSRPGVTIEDLVREEIRPLLKNWLDTHLPAIVERLVRAEIERVVSRQTG